MRTNGRPIRILLVEDNPGDIELTKVALEENKLNNNLHVVMDGEEASDYLYRRGNYTDAPRPDLILLDLNLPRKDGRQVLEEIKSDPDLSDIPVVILTTSAADEDILRAYQLHVNCYVRKPLDLDQFVKVVQSIESFWLSIVELPDRE
ncbi:MAG: response regulator [Candidatus Pacebacteria bacterium]|nr:response regulator [Candidatus Paceibacterota bacterium]